jgi:hypothetical protein
MTQKENDVGRPQHELNGRKISEDVQRVLQDDATQIELVDPQLRDALKGAPYYDRHPNGSGPFGLCKSNPIPTNGPIGELAYLSKLVTNGGERLLFHRLLTVDNIDIFEAVTFSGREWYIFFLDMHHSKKSRIAPEGFELSSSACLFSGFHNFCEDFPYDFMHVRQREALRSAYMPTWEILRAIESRAYQRQSNHQTRLDLLKSETDTSTSVEESVKPVEISQYLSLIDRAISDLISNTHESREAIYGQARSVLLAQLRRLTPPASEQIIRREQRTLEAAIQEAEGRVSGKQRSLQGL